MSFPLKVFFIIFYFLFFYYFFIIFYGLHPCRRLSRQALGASEEYTVVIE
jgi:hypothetical protein